MGWGTPASFSQPSLENPAFRGEFHFPGQLEGEQGFFSRQLVLQQASEQLGGDVFEDRVGGVGEHQVERSFKARLGAQGVARDDFITLFAYAGAFADGGQIAAQEVCDPCILFHESALGRSSTDGFESVGTAAREEIEKGGSDDEIAEGGEEAFADGF